MDNNRIKGLVLDFDGTMCLLFQNYSLLPISKELSSEMKAFRIIFPDEADPFDVFECILEQTQPGAKRKQALIRANSLLVEAELEAIDSCLPVDYLNDCIVYCKKNNIPFGIATNNSVLCVKKFLTKYCNNAFVHVVGRIAETPTKMKPNPWSISEISNLLHIPPENLLLIGDSERDYSASQQIGCDFIGMAPTEKKYNRLCKFLTPNEIFVNFQEILPLLTTISKNNSKPLYVI